MRTSIGGVIVSHDYGGEVYDVTMTAREIHQMYKHGLLVIDPERQRGVNTVTGREVFRKEKVQRWTEQLLADKAVFGQLSWNFRPEETKAYFDRQTGEFVIEHGSATLPDSAHRHRAIFAAVESFARGSTFHLDLPFSVRIWCVPAAVENDIFYGYNQEGDKADATRSKWLSQKNIGQRLAAAVVRTSPHLTESNVETVTNTLSAKNPRLAAFNTFSTAFEAAWPDIPDADIDKVAAWFVGYWDKLVSVRPELKRMPAAQRQQTRRSLMSVSAIGIHGYIRLARVFYDQGLDLGKLDALKDDKFFAIANPAWQKRGIIVPGTNKAGQAVYQLRNANQTRKAMADALMNQVGVAPVSTANAPVAAVPVPVPVPAGVA